MSTLYPDLDNKFPVEIDDFEKFSDPSVSMLAAIQQYKQYYNAGNMASAVAVLEKNPDLRRCILNAENMNKLRDAIISIQRYYMDDVQEYLVNIIKWKGEFSSTARYTKYNVVSYTRKDAIETFMAIVTDIPIGTLPTNPDYWVPITLRGEQGASGTGLSGRGNWKSTAQYYVDDWVAHNGTIWAASKENFNSEPYDGSPDWYAVIRDQQHYVISKDQPTAQYTNDIWYEIRDDGSIQPHKKLPDGSYAAFNFTSDAVVAPDGTRLSESLKKYAQCKQVEYTAQASNWLAVDGYDDVFEQQIVDSSVTKYIKAGRTRIDCLMDYAQQLELEDIGVEKMWVENQNGLAMLYQRGVQLTDDVLVQLSLIDVAQ